MKSNESDIYSKSSHSLIESLEDNIEKGSALSAALLKNKRYFWFLVVYLVLESALGSFVNDMYSPALPNMCRFFGCAVSIGQMGLTMGMIGLGVGQIFLGPLSDRYGRKPILVGSLLLFIIAAIVSVFSPTIHFFNGCRFFQGIGASGGYFLARTIPADVLSGRSLAKLMALVGAINGVAPASAPVIGGIASDAFGWKGVFIILAVFGFIILLLSPVLKESLPLTRRTKGSWWVSMKGYGVLMRNRKFMTHVCFKGTALGLLFAYLSSSPFILQRYYGMSQTVYGLVVGFNALFVVVGSMIALKFHPLKKSATYGAFILLLGVIGQAVALFTVKNIWIFEIWMGIMLFGLGMIFTTTNTLAMNEGRDQAGEASSLLGVSGYFFGAIVSPLVGLGNILHSTAIAYLALMALVVICAVLSRKIAPDLDPDPDMENNINQK